MKYIHYYRKNIKIMETANKTTLFIILVAHTYTHTICEHQVCQIAFTDKEKEYGRI
jgi:hypothetical protein